MSWEASWITSFPIVKLWQRENLAKCSLMAPTSSRAAPKKTEELWGMGDSQAFTSLPVPQAVSVLLLMFTKQVWWWCGLSKDQIPPRLSLGSFLLLAGAGPWDGHREEKPSSAASVTLSAHFSSHLQLHFPTHRCRYAGVSSWDLASTLLPWASLLTGGSCQAEGGRKVFLGLLI